MAVHHSFPHSHGGRSVSLAVKGGPRYGIDFKGGALVTVAFAERPPVDKVRAALAGKLPVDVQEVYGTAERHRTSSEPMCGTTWRCKLPGKPSWTA